jgi:subtilisin family serine protease
MKTTTVFATAIMAMAGHALATDRVWVVFADKGYSDTAAEVRAVEALAATAPAKQVQRRTLRRTAPGLFDERDLPVATGYRAAVEAVGGVIRHESRWLNAVSVVAPNTATIERLRGIPGVVRVEPVRGGRVARPEERPYESGPFEARDYYGAASEQLHQISIPPLHSAGMSGRGVIIGVLDTGFVTTHRAFNEPGRPLDIVAAWDFVDNDANVGIEPNDHPDQHRHGTWILGCISAGWPDVIVGGAPDAAVVLCKTENYASETPVEEDAYVAGLEFAEFHGADVVTSSLGYIDWYTQADLDGATAVTTIAVNLATANGMVCVTAAGNEGNDSNPTTSRLIAPADALQVITCGAVDANAVTAGFSSDGPTADGRVKPEIMARGVNTRTVSSRNNDGIGEVSGTSLSTPLVAAAVACIVQAHPCWSVDRIRGALFATASGGGAADPMFVRGYGIINAAAAAPVSACPGDFNADGFLDFFDYDAFVACFEGEACPPCETADHNGDGFVDFFDYDDYVRTFEIGC